MTCKACKHDHPPAQDCKVAARIRVTVTPDVTLPVTKLERPVTKLVTVTTTKAHAVTKFEYPNVYPDPSALGLDALDWPKPAKLAAQRMREMRARRKAKVCQQ